MKRSDEILQAALPYIDEPQAYRGFIFGADWADAHPDISVASALAYEAGQNDARPKWISVSEQLPLGWALVCEEKTHCVSIARKMHNEKTNRDYWEELDGYPLPDNVTHWMPLPEPPKGGER